jgi:hypothetical protein
MPAAPPCSLWATIGVPKPRVECESSPELFQISNLSRSRTTTESNESDIPRADRPLRYRENGGSVRKRSPYDAMGIGVGRWCHISMRSALLRPLSETGRAANSCALRCNEQAHRRSKYNPSRGHSHLAVTSAQGASFTATPRRPRPFVTASLRLPVDVQKCVRMGRVDELPCAGRVTSELPAKSTAKGLNTARSSDRSRTSATPQSRIVRTARAAT